MKKIAPLLMLMSITIIHAQEIHFQNPSFEDTIMSYHRTPMQWKKCFGTPDVQPVPFYNFIDPSDGNSYAGMWTEKFGWREAISQQFENNLNKGTKYNFSIDLAYLKRYSLNADGPGKLQIWLGNDTCEFTQMIYETAILDTFWKTYSVVFTPTENYQSISFNAELYDSSQSNYIFLDNLSVIDTVKELNTTVESNVLTNFDVINNRSELVMINNTSNVGFIRIFTLQGKELYNTKIQPGHNTIETDNNFLKGMMILVVNINQVTTTQKIIID